MYVLQTKWKLFGLVAGVTVVVSFILTVLLSRGYILGHEDVGVLSVEVQPVFGLVVDQNMTVIDIEAGSAAEKAGIKRGDKVLAVYGQTVTSFEEAAHIVDAIHGRQVAEAQPLAGQDLAQADAEAQARINEALKQAQNRSNPREGQITIMRNKVEQTISIPLTAPLRRPAQPTPTPVPDKLLYF